MVTWQDLSRQLWDERAPAIPRPARASHVTCTHCTVCVERADCEKSLTHRLSSDELNLPQQLNPIQECVNWPLVIITDWRWWWVVGCYSCVENEEPGVLEMTCLVLIPAQQQQLELWSWSMQLGPVGVSYSVPPWREVTLLLDFKMADYISRPKRWTFDPAALRMWIKWRSDWRSSVSFVMIETVGSGSVAQRVNVAHVHHSSRNDYSFWNNVNSLKWFPLVLIWVWIMNKNVF